MRQVSRLLGVARQAAPSIAAAADQAVWDACAASRTTWLRQPAAAAGGSSGGSAACPAAAAAPAAAWGRGLRHAARTLHSSSPAQHNAAAAAAAAQPEAAQQQAARPARERTCWQCGTQLGGHDLFFCPSCDSVQPAGMESEYFQVFDMDEPRFDLDVAALERQYKALQRQLHPDKYTRASSLEQEYAHQQAAVVNQAYDVLKKPLRRAHYMLNQAGYGACEGMTITDPELLMGVMEAREEVEAAGGDAGRLQPLLDRMRRLHDELVQELVGAFGGGDLAHAAELTTQLRYVCRIKEAILEQM